MDHASMVRGSDSFAHPQEKAQGLDDCPQWQELAAQRPKRTKGRDKEAQAVFVLAVILDGE